MFAFNELISEMGYKTIDYFIEQRHEKLISKASQLFQQHKKELDYLKTTVDEANFTIDKY